MDRTIYFTSRGFAILFILMTALFVLDLDKFSWSGLFFHLLPTLVLLLIFFVSLFKSRLGGLLWILAAIFYIVWAWGKVEWLSYVMMAGPSIVIGLLFLFEKRNNMHQVNDQKQAPVAPGPTPIAPEQDNNQVENS